MNIIHSLSSSIQDKNSEKKSEHLDIIKNSSISKNFNSTNKKIVQIGKFFIEVNILHKKKHHRFICKLIGQDKDIAAFQDVTGILVHRLDQFDDSDENDLRLVFSQLGKS